MELFFSEKLDSDQIIFDDEESHHTLRVMRHRIGDELMVTDGKGKLIRAKLIGEEKKQCRLEVLEVMRQEREISPQIHVAIAPTKNIDRFEWFLEKATEIGANEISPIISRRSERDKIKHERLSKIVLASMKQSLRLWLPKLNPLVSFKEFASRESSFPGQKFIAHCQSQNLPALKSLYEKGKDVLVMIGPEGDFTTDEITLAEETSFISVSISESRLRTETAGLVATHTVKLLND